MAVDEWQPWAAERGMTYLPTWPQLRGVFQAGQLSSHGARLITNGWSGTLGGLPCFGFKAGAGEDPRGPIQVGAIQVPGAQFPVLELRESGSAGPSGQPIDSLFDLAWTVSTKQPRFARDLLGSAMREQLLELRPDFSTIWFERDAVLLGARGEVSPASMDRYLSLLRRMVDNIPRIVLDTVRQRSAQVNLAPPLGVIPPIPQLSWSSWAAQRGWLHYPSAGEIVERFNQGPVPEGRFTDGFVGKFGSLPTFGWRWINREGLPRNVICLRQAGLKVPAVRLTRENALLAELIGSGDIEVGDPEFDAQWRVTSQSPQAARAMLRPSVWHLFRSAPPFAQLWFERDVAAIVTETPITPHEVDGFLRFLHQMLGVITAELAAELRHN